MFKNKKLIVVILLLAGVLGYYGYSKNISATKDAEEDKKVATTTYTVKKMNIGESLDTTGRVKSKYEADISSKISSDFIDINVEVGDKLNKDDLIATLDKSDIELQILSKEQQILEVKADLTSLKKEGNQSYKNAYNNSKSTYESKKRTYDNNVILYNASSISSIELEDSKEDKDKAYNDYQDAKIRYESFDLNTEIKILESSLEIHEKNLNILNKNLESVLIKAPFDSVVTDIYLDDEDVVREESLIAHVMDLSNLMIELEVSEYEVYKLKQGQNVSISPYGQSEKNYKGIVSKIYPSGSTDDDQSYVKVEIEVLNPDKSLKPGFSASLTIEISQKDNALVVPYDALIKTKKGYLITKINEDATKESIIVETGIESDLFIEIISKDLKEGDNVLVMSQIDYSKTKEADAKGLGTLKIPRGGGTGGK